MYGQATRRLRVSQAFTPSLVCAHFTFPRIIFNSRLFCHQPHRAVRSTFGEIPFTTTLTAYSVLKSEFPDHILNKIWMTILMSCSSIRVLKAKSTAQRLAHHSMNARLCHIESEKMKCLVIPIPGDDQTHPLENYAAQNWTKNQSHQM
jgi:hypothetical protein